MSHATVHVSGISSTTSEKEVRDFFSFCGKIVTLSITPVSGEPDAQKSATVTFEKEAAAKTALLLDQTQLGTSAVHVEAAHNIEDLAGAQAAPAGSETKDEEHHIAQEDKPRSRIVAEYLAHGYVVSDNAIMKAIQLDKKHGVSSRFTSALTNFDKKYNATERAKGIDENYQISNKAASGWRGLSSYFEKALEHPSGQKLRDFYVQTDKQVRDIHAEARRLADLKQGKSGEATPAATAEPEAPAAAPAPAQPEAAAAPSEKV
ncbi:Nucleotide-binding, alpha-beta plait [Penicillium griseofulvum]|uniref:Nucleotide-binding, alpha-beta plait n=1 Tax=Penicillium patulum TaxID=5078 RepID=A0A135LYN2_PENPA|nr:Nucleotide-binding, alpha-beta plait [Penicillium griseofulvum]KXG54068.1 Nucleotide-binding, alpha-beta plait [Penicillium griseofulvum]